MQLAGHCTIGEQKKLLLVCSVEWLFVQWGENLVVMLSAEPEKGRGLIAADRPKPDIRPCLRKARRESDDVALIFKQVDHTAILYRVGLNWGILALHRRRKALSELPVIDTKGLPQELLIFRR